MAFCIGLTGGIGSGKSSAARHFQSLGAGVVDVDDISHTLTKPAGAAIPEIACQFGAAFIAADGSLDRAKMRELRGVRRTDNRADRAGMRLSERLEVAGDDV